MVSFLPHLWDTLGLQGHLFYAGIVRLMPARSIGTNVEMVKAQERVRSRKINPPQPGTAKRVFDILAAYLPPAFRPSVGIMNSEDSARDEVVGIFLEGQGANQYKLPVGGKNKKSFNMPYTSAMQEHLNDPTFVRGGEEALGGQNERLTYKMFVAVLDILHDILDRVGVQSEDPFMQVLNPLVDAAKGNTSTVSFIKEIAHVPSNKRPSKDQVRVYVVMNMFMNGGFGRGSIPAEIIKNHELLKPTTLHTLKYTLLGTVLHKFASPKMPLSPDNLTDFTYSVIHLAGSQNITADLRDMTARVNAGFRQHPTSAEFGALYEDVGEEPIDTTQFELEYRQFFRSGHSVGHEQALNSASGRVSNGNVGGRQTSHINNIIPTTNVNKTKVNAALEILRPGRENNGKFAPVGTTTYHGKFGCTIFQEVSPPPKTAKGGAIYVSGDVIVAIGFEDVKLTGGWENVVSPEARKNHIWLYTGSNPEEGGVILFYIQAPTARGPTAGEVTKMFKYSMARWVTVGLMTIKAGALLMFMLIKSVGDENQTIMNRARNLMVFEKFNNGNQVSQFSYVITEDILLAVNAILNGAAVLLKSSDTYQFFSPMWIAYSVGVTHTIIHTKIKDWIDLSVRPGAGTPNEKKQFLQSLLRIKPRVAEAANLTPSTMENVRAGELNQGNITTLSRYILKGGYVKRIGVSIGLLDDEVARFWDAVKLKDPRWAGTLKMVLRKAPYILYNVIKELNLPQEGVLAHQAAQENAAHAAAYQQAVEEGRGNLLKNMEGAEQDEANVENVKFNPEKMFKMVGGTGTRHKPSGKPLKGVTKQRGRKR